MNADNGMNIHLSNEMVEAIRKRGHSTSANEIQKTVCRWQGFLNEGARELDRIFTRQELEEITRIIITQAKEDRLTHKEFWDMNAERLGETVRMYKEELGEKMVRLGELAAIALKERVGGVIVFPPGTGGRPRNG